MTQGPARRPHGAAPFGDFLHQRSDVTTIVLDGEAVVYDDRAQRVVVLNRVATLLWQRFEAPIGLRELTQQLTREFDAEPDTIAADVRGVVDTLLSKGLLTNGTDPRPPSPSSTSLPPTTADVGAAPGQRFLEEPPSGCRQRVDRLGWTAPATFRIGELSIGVRSATSEVDRVLRQVLADHLEPGVDAPANFSVDGRRPGQTVGRAIHRLYRSCTPVVRAQASSRIAWALLAHLGAFVERTRTDAPVLGAMTLVSGDHAVLAPPLARRHLDRLEPLLRRRGIGVADSPVVRLDAEPRSIVLPVPNLRLAPHTAALLDGLDDDVEAESAHAGWVAPGTYRLAGWLLLDDRATSTSSASAARGIATYTAEVDNLPRIEGESAIDRLRSLLTAAPGVAVPRAQPACLAEAVSMLLAD